MTNWQAKRITANGLKIHYHRTGGDKPPIVLLHGITDNGLCWTRLAQALEDAYDLIMVDARGHGHSDKPNSGYNSADHAADVAGLIQALGLVKPVVMGHSMGGATATAVGATYPDLVGALILEDPPWRPADAGSDEERAKARAEWQTNLAAQKQRTHAEIMAAGMERSPTWDASEFSNWADAKLQVSLNVLDIIRGSLNAWPEQIPQIQCPTLLVTAETEAGGIVNAEVTQKALALNPHLQHAHIAGAGHNIRREQFDRFLQAVRAFLQQIQAGSA